MGTHPRNALVDWARRVDAGMTDAQVWGLLILAVAMLGLLAWIYVAKVYAPALNPPPPQIVRVTVTATTPTGPVPG